MDSITQAALGGLCGEMTLRKQLGWKGMAWGIFFGTLPDLDIIAFLWLDATERLGWHRGLSHSILVMVLASVIFGWLLAKLHRKRGVTFKRAAWFVFLTWFTHVLVDCFNTYGTQVFEPFSNYRASLDNMSIIDVAFTLPMLLALLIALFHDKDSIKRIRIGRFITTWLCIYVAGSFVIKQEANAYFEKQLAKRGIKPDRVMTSPTIANIFLWRMVAETEGQFHVSYWSLFDPSGAQADITPIAKGHEHLESFDHFPETKSLRWFAKDWYVVVPDEDNPGKVLFIDMRFAELITKAYKRPAFVWRLETDPDGPEHLKFSSVPYRKGAPMGEAIGLLWNRIRGQDSDWMDVPWIWQNQTNTEKP